VGLPFVCCSGPAATAGCTSPSSELVAAAEVLPAFVGAVTPIRDHVGVRGEADGVRRIRARCIRDDVSSISHVTAVSTPFLRTVYLKPLLLAGGASMRIRKSESVPVTVIVCVTLPRQHHAR